MLLNPIVFALLMMAILLLMRSSRASYMHRLERQHVIDMFRESRSEDECFRGSRAIIVYDDWRLDRWGPDNFHDVRCPVSALMIARNPEGSYFLWTYSDALQPEARLEPLDLTHDKDAHKLGRGLLARRFPQRLVWRATWRAWKAKTDRRPEHRRHLRKR